MGDTAWTVLAALLCLGTGLTCLALAAAGIGDRGAQLTHAAMGGTMAAMLSPWPDAVPPWLGVAGFTVLGAWFAAAALRGVRAGAPAHLAISSAAMVLMYLTHHAAGPGPDGGGHAGHATGTSTNLAVLPLALLLAGYFAWHTWTCVDRARTASAVTSGRAAGPGPRAPARVEPVAHAVMSGLMAAMFLGVV